jgi:hypothetical protein
VLLHLTETEDFPMIERIYRGLVSRAVKELVYGKLERRSCTTTGRSIASSRWPKADHGGHARSGTRWWSSWKRGSPQTMLVNIPRSGALSEIVSRIAAFSRVCCGRARRAGDGALATTTINRVVHLLDSFNELDEFKQARSAR